MSKNQLGPRLQITNLQLRQQRFSCELISILNRFLLFTDYKPDFLNITYDGSKWNISFTPTPKAKINPQPALKRLHIRDLIEAGLLAAGTKLRYKRKPSIIATVLADGKLKVGKDIFSSPSSAATKFASAGRRDGWFCWLFQDKDGEYKPIDLLRERWKSLVTKDAR
ncbi:MAG: hypothetical protein RMM17_10255 [Acidobacteriota bacterium]|nr:hypothetical protein [Blastocatellia bacterium]MDW8413051.1 hypothetical protein [Acidobacteriota bacterium]